MEFKLVSSVKQASADAIIVTLFLCPQHRVRGWIIGPVQSLKDGAVVPYVAPSVRMLGITALARADRLAGEAGLAVYVVDPDDLWNRLMEV